jgi:hypothetical protein
MLVPSSLMVPLVICIEFSRRVVCGGIVGTLHLPGVSQACELEVAVPIMPRRQIGGE